jgi:hypothetical protein
MSETLANTVAFIGRSIGFLFKAVLIDQHHSKGLGVMGYPMAKNLRAGLGQDTKLLICDVNTDALDRFKVETEGQGRVEVVSNGYEAAKTAVRKQPLMTV